MKNKVFNGMVVVCFAGLLAMGTRAEAGRFFIAGIDETGSFEQRGRSMAALESLILKVMQPGDSLFGRRITDQSYLDRPENQLFPRLVEIPAARMGTVNVLSARYKRDAELGKNRQTLAKLQAIKQLRSLKPVKAPMTDIQGFLAACSDRLVRTDQFSERIILEASKAHRQHKELSS